MELAPRRDRGERGVVRELRALSGSLVTRICVDGKMSPEIVGVGNSPSRSGVATTRGSGCAWAALCRSGGACPLLRSRGPSDLEPDRAGSRHRCGSMRSNAAPCSPLSASTRYSSPCFRLPKLRVAGSNPVSRSRLRERPRPVRPGALSSGATPWEEERVLVLQAPDGRAKISLSRRTVFAWDAFQTRRRLRFAGSPIRGR